MKISKHTHPLYIVWLKYLLAIFAFILPFYFLHTDFVKYSRSASFASAAALDVIIGIPFGSLPGLGTAYFFQNVAVTDDGLLVEFLWKDLFVPWNKIVEIKSAYGFLGNSRNTKIYVVLTDALTSFHRSFGARCDIWSFCKTSFHNLFYNQ